MKKEKTSQEDKEEILDPETLETNLNEDPSEEALEIKEEDNTNAELEELREENLKLKNEFLRAHADAENTKKRCLQEIEKNNKYAISSFAKSLLSVADNLNRAINAAKEDAKPDSENLIQGVELTQTELANVFAKFDIKKMDIVGTIFDPNFHQVIQEVEDANKPNGTIIAELQTGYMINDRILREAMVIVSKGGK